jgi:hypothetical protein
LQAWLVADSSEVAGSYSLLAPEPRNNLEAIRPSVLPKYFQHQPRGCIFVAGLFGDFFK